MNHTQMWLYLTNQSEPLRQTSLLMLLAGGIGNGDSLLQGLKSHESECAGTWAGKIAQMRVLMEQGHLLSHALTIVDELLPDQTIAAIRVAEATGTLPDVLMDEARRISSDMQSRRVTGIGLESMAVWIPCVSIVIFGILMYLMIFIVPKLKNIFEGFGSELPTITKAAISVSDMAYQYWYVFGLPVIAMLVYAGFAIFGSQKRMLMRGYHRFAEHWPRYWLPVLLRQLSVSALANAPLSMALDSALQHMPPGRASKRVSDLRHRVQGGQDLLDSMYRTRLITSAEAAFLESALRTHHLDWGLRHLAESVERKRQRWMRRIPELIGPLVVVAMGLVVLFVVLAFFLPLVKLISDLA